ncbi:hypothetical protein S1OALGB6SA_686 [Olavius algarvensis spirochete endosymbiont]|nr:hypothetical protein S1OALGB6SA_686 [Olavius algarvensis spirochete endosymbiont]
MANGKSLYGNDMGVYIKIADIIGYHQDIAEF